MSPWATISTGVLTSIFAAEAIGLSSAAAPKLLRRAVNRLPRKRRERYAEEWAGDLADQPTALGKLLFSLGLCVAAHRILERDRRAVISARYRSAKARRIELVFALAAMAIKLEGRISDARDAGGLVRAPLIGAMSLLLSHVRIALIIAAAIVGEVGGN